MRDVVQEIKDIIKIEDLVSQYVQLKKVGINFKGLCPFHSEKTPSFIVSPERQIAYCFGCNKGGDIFTFIQEVEGVDFNDALKVLADKSGVVLDTRENFKPFVTGGQKDELIKMHDILTSFYEQNLWGTSEGKNVLKYLYSRGLKDETIKFFRLGFALDSYENTYKYLINKGFSKKTILNGGVIVSKDTTLDKVYDKFRNRLIFPISDNMGRVVGFGGRALSADQEPKYLNTQETPIYHKSNILYGFHNSKQKIKEKDEVIFVEGYFDVILANQIGLKNVVAPCGTSLTSSQLRLIKPFAYNVVFAFDMDFAGQEAVQRAFELSQEFSFNCKVVVFPEGMDPADYILKYGDNILDLISKSILYEDYKYNQILNSYDPSSYLSKKNVLKEFIPFLAQLKSNIEKDEYIRRLASDLDIKEVQIYDEMKNFNLPKFHPARISSDDNSKEILNNKPKSSNETLLGLIVQFPKVGKLFIRNINEDFFDTDLKAIYKAFYHHYNSDNSEADLAFLDILSRELREYVSLITLYIEQKYGDIPDNVVEKEIKLLIDNIKRDQINIKRGNVKKRLVNAEKEGNKELCETLLRELNKLYENL